MYFKPSKLEREIYKWRTFEILFARRMATTNKTKLMNIVKKPKYIGIPHQPPSWTILPLYHGVPLPEATPGTIKLTRGKPGHDLRRPCRAFFDLGDPNRYTVDTIKYDLIHDEYLLHHFQDNPRLKRQLQANGILSESGMATCNLKSLNDFRRYLYSIHRRNVRKELIKSEIEVRLKRKFCEFLESAKETIKLFKQVRSVEKQIIQRKYARSFIEILNRKRMEMRHIRTEKNYLLYKEKQTDLWILHKIKEKRYTIERKERIERALKSTIGREVKFIFKWERFNYCQKTRENIKLQCQALRNILVDLNWKRRTFMQISILKRDFIICNNYADYSAKRRRIRDNNFRLQRLAMDQKYNRIRNDRQFDVILKWSKHQRYQLAAGFLVGRYKYPPAFHRTWNLIPLPENSDVEYIQGEEQEIDPNRLSAYFKVTDDRNLRKKWIPMSYRERRMVAKKLSEDEKKNQLDLLDNFLPEPFISNMAYQCHKLAKTANAFRYTYSSSIGLHVTDEVMNQILQDILFDKIAWRCAWHLKKCRHIVMNIKESHEVHREISPKTSDEIVKQFSWRHELTFKEIADNVSPECIIEKRLEQAVRRFMKHERRRLQLAKKFPEWNYYNLGSCKNKQPQIDTPERSYYYERTLNRMYFSENQNKLGPTLYIRRQVPISQWVDYFHKMTTWKSSPAAIKSNKNSLGHYLTNVLINTHSFDNKKKIISNHFTKLKAIKLKVKNKVRIIFHTLLKMMVKHEYNQYPSKKDTKSLCIVRENVRNILSIDPCNGDGHVEGLARLVSFFSLYRIKYQYLAPFADIFMLNIYFPRQFPLSFEKYEKIDHSTEFFPYPKSKAEYQQKLDAIAHELRVIHRLKRPYIKKVGASDMYRLKVQYQPLVMYINNFVQNKCKKIRKL